MGLRDLVNKFTAGELDPKMLAEVDYEGYRKGARKLRNVVCIPQGGVIRRFGTIYEQVIMDGGDFITDRDMVRLIEYEHASGDKYDIIIRQDSTNDVAFDIYLDEVLVTSIAAPANTYTDDMIREIRWVEDYDRLILLHEDVRPYELRRNNQVVWSLSAIAFKFFPTFDFSFSDDPADPLTPPSYWAAGVTFTPNPADATTVTSNTAVFTSNHVGGLYYGNGGVFRIESVDAAGMVATGFCLVEFPDTSVIKGELSVLAERAWNDGQAIAGAPAGINRGWPRHGNFYQSRLVLGGSPALPGVAVASVVKEYYNFDDSDSDATSSYGAEAGVSGNDVINDIMAVKSLILLSDKGPASTTILLDTPTTPTNVFVNSQGTEGSRNMDGVLIDNQIVYADRAGNTIWSMAYEIPDTGYDVNNASILSSHLIRNPRWADVFDPDNVDGRYYLLVNDDETLAVYQTIRNENIKSWTLANTIGGFIDVGCIANQAKVLTRRKVNTGALANGVFDAVYNVDGTFNAFRNITDQVDGSGVGSIFLADEDYLLIGNEIPFTKFSATVALASVSDLDLTWQFLTNTGSWETFTPTDGTNGFTQSGNITWDIDDVSNWKAQTIEDTDTIYNELPSYYWIRVQRNNPLGTSPAISSFLVNTENRIFLERLSFDVVMDAQTSTTSGADGSVGGLTHLAGQNAFFFADGFPLKTYYIDSDGNATVENAPMADITVGLDSPPILTPMPIIAILQNGWAVYEDMHVERMFVDFYQSLGITVQGQNIPQLVPGNFMTQETPVPFTGYYKLPTYGGWDPRFEFVISQSYPAPMTILGISFTVEVNP